MDSQHKSIKEAFDLPVGSRITVRGWVRSRRDSKGVTFIELNDGSRFKSLQLVVENGIVAHETLTEVTTGSSISASGTLVESPAKGQAVDWLDIALLVLTTDKDKAARHRRKTASFYYKTLRSKQTSE